MAATHKCLLLTKRDRLSKSTRFIAKERNKEIVYRRDFPTFCEWFIYKHILIPECFCSSPKQTAQFQKLKERDNHKNTTSSLIWSLLCVCLITGVQESVHLLPVIFPPLCFRDLVPVSTLQIVAWARCQFRSREVCSALCIWHLNPTASLSGPDSCLAAFVFSPTTVLTQYVAF